MPPASEIFPASRPPWCAARSAAHAEIALTVSAVIDNVDRGALRLDVTDAASASHGDHRDRGERRPMASMSSPPAYRQNLRRCDDSTRLPVTRPRRISPFTASVVDLRVQPVYHRFAVESRACLPLHARPLPRMAHAPPLARDVSTTRRSRGRARPPAWCRRRSAPGAVAKRITRLTGDGLTVRFHSLPADLRPRTPTPSSPRCTPDCPLTVLARPTPIRRGIGLLRVAILPVTDSPEMLPSTIRALTGHTPKFGLGSHP